MCGICGFTGEILDKEQVLKSMTDRLIHRGPNSEGFYFSSEISMGFRRLSIIDVDERSNQPMYNEDKTLVLTFNGEIYNYKELREELAARGHTFCSNTDSEVLVHGFEQWREKLLDKVRGMFAFAIFNMSDNSLFMARDFFGIKPLHYAIADGHLVYASEIKSILQFPKIKKGSIRGRSINICRFSIPSRQRPYLRAFTACCRGIICGIGAESSKSRAISNQNSNRIKL